MSSAVISTRPSDSPTPVAVDTKMAELKLREFVIQAWPEVEPGRDLVPGFYVDAICDHLQAVAEGEITRLVITLPPGFLKSTLVSVLFPAWLWIDRPSFRFLTTSHDSDLAMRDAVRSRRVIASDWYQARWGNRFQMTTDQNVKTRYENDKTGHRISLGTGSGVTGKRGDMLLCLPYDELVWTEDGPVAIGELVEERRQVNVWCYDVANEQVVLRPIEKWHEVLAAEIVEVILSDGAKLYCTRDHRILTENRGWVEAGSLRPSDVLPNPALPDVLDQSFIDPKLAAKRAGRSVRFDDEMNVVFAQLSAMTGAVGGEANIFGDFDPGQPISNLLDGSTLHSETFGQYSSRLGARGDLAGLVLGQDGSGTVFVDRERAVDLGIADVLGACPVLQVGEHSVSAVSVAMADFLTFWAGSDEGSHDDLVNEHLGSDTIPHDVEAGIAFGGRRLQNAFPHRDGLAVALHHGAGMALDSAKVGDAVPALPSRYRSPLLVRHHSYAPMTYCITVEEHHNFLAGDKIIIANCDDPHDAEDAYSPKNLEAAVRWWNETMPSRLNDPKTGAKIVIQQRIHVNDLAGNVIEQGYEHLNLPMEYDPDHAHITSIGWADPRTERGEVLDPVRYGPDEIAEKKTELGTQAYAAQYQQQPVSAEGGMFKRHWWRYWQPRGENYPAVPVKMPDGSTRHVWAEEQPAWWDVQAQSWDMTFKETKSGSYVVGLVGAMSGPNGYLLDCYRDRVEFTAAVAAVRQMTRNHPDAGAKLIEDKANGPAVIDTLSNDISGIIPVGVDGSKQARAASSTPRVEAGNWYVPHPDMPGAEWVPAFIEECAAFPDGSHDDQVDAFSQLDRYLASNVAGLDDYFTYMSNQRGR